MPFWAWLPHIGTFSLLGVRAIGGPRLVELGSPGLQPAQSSFGACAWAFVELVHLLRRSMAAQGPRPPAIPADAAIPTRAHAAAGRCWVFSLPNTNPVEGSPAVLAAEGMFPSSANKATADAFCQWVPCAPYPASAGTPYLLAPPPLWQALTGTCAAPAAALLTASEHSPCTHAPLARPSRHRPALPVLPPARSRAKGYKLAVNYVIQPYAGWSWLPGTLSIDGAAACARDKCPGECAGAALHGPRCSNRPPQRPAAGLALAAWLALHQPPPARARPPPRPAGFLYIVCAKGPGVLPTCANAPNGNVGFGNTGRNNIGNNK